MLRNCFSIYIYNRAGTPSIARTRILTRVAPHASYMTITSLSSNDPTCPKCQGWSSKGPTGNTTSRAIARTEQTADGSRLDAGDHQLSSEGYTQMWNRFPSYCTALVHDVANILEQSSVTLDAKNYQGLRLTNIHPNIDRGKTRRILVEVKKEPLARPWNLDHSGIDRFWREEKHWTC